MSAWQTFGFVVIGLSAVGSLAHWGDKLLKAQDRTNALLAQIENHLALTRIEDRYKS